MTVASGESAGVGGSSEPWLPLLRALTAREPSWCVWKNAEKAVAGEGDVDSAAPRRAWAAIEDEFRTWAFAAGAGPVIVCRHLPETLVVAACARADRRRLVQLDAYERVARIVPAEALAGVAEVDELGYRRLRPGAEGLFLLLTVAPRGGRRPTDGGSIDRAATLVRVDPAGVDAAARLLGGGRRQALAAADSIAAGGWNRAAMAALELVYVQRAVREPGRRLAWLSFKVGAASRCPLLAALLNGRRIAGEVDAWLGLVRSSHIVFEA
jgi:hypothetical protein